MIQYVYHNISSLEVHRCLSLPLTRKNLHRLLLPLASATPDPPSAVPFALPPPPPLATSICCAAPPMRLALSTTPTATSGTLSTAATSTLRCPNAALLKTFVQCSHKMEKQDPRHAIQLLGPLQAHGRHGEGSSSVRPKNDDFDNHDGGRRSVIK